MPESEPLPRFDLAGKPIGGEQPITGIDNKGFVPWSTILKRESETAYVDPEFEYGDGFMDSESTLVPRKDIS